MTDKDITITTKIYPTKYKNRKGFQIGNMVIKFDTKNAPFSSSDQIDNYLNELFSYIKWETTKTDLTIDERKKTIHDFLKAKKIEHVFSPKVIETNVIKAKGGKRNATRKRKYKNNKTRRKRDKDKK